MRSAFGQNLNIDATRSAHYPKLAITSTGMAYVGWLEMKNDLSADNIYMKQFDGLSVWSSLGGSISVNPVGILDNFDIALNNGTPYITWAEARGNTAQTYVKHWTGAAWVQDGDPIPSLNAVSFAFGLSLAFQGNDAWVAWPRFFLGTLQTYVARYQLPSPTPTPITGTGDHFFKIYHSQINPQHGDQARIIWTQNQDGPVTLTLYNLLGDQIIRLSDHRNFVANTTHELTWNGR